MTIENAVNDGLIMFEQWNNQPEPNNACTYFGKHQI